MLRIEKATALDAEKVLEYCKIIGGESDNLTFGTEGVPMTVEAEREYFERVSKSNRQVYLVAKIDGNVVGTATLACFERPRLAHRAEISISVRKDYWGNGIGTKLMQELIDFAKNSAGAEIISLEVRSDNRRAVALYEKFGFETIGRFPGFMKINGEDVSCDIMRLHLD